MSAARLTIVHTESSVGWGGQELRILSESAGMIERGHSVTIVCPEEARIFQEAKERDIPVMALPIARKNLHGLLALRTWLKAHQLDLLNTHSSTDSWLTALACASLHRAPPIVRTRHISTAIANNVGTHWLYQYAAIHVVTTGER
ncbi:MAG: glycosyltransferase, partial [Burkholderiales bacterium]|nr:glycosyltransferase [Burkholderiales bacterium]